MSGLSEHEHQWDVVAMVRDDNDKLVNQIFRCASCGDMMHDDIEDHPVSGAMTGSSDAHYSGPPWASQDELELEAAWRE